VTLDMFPIFLQLKPVTSLHPNIDLTFNGVVFW